MAFHAHPDDEALLTGGTLARAAAAGHRVVVVAATDGHMDALPPGGAPRLAELRASAAALGVRRVECLGYADSGHGPLLYPDPPDRPRFAAVDTGRAAARLAALLAEERAQMLIGYDPAGGYGHRDHVQVHRVGERAAALAGTPRVWQATLPRELVGRLVGAARAVGGPLDPSELGEVFTPSARITHRVDVRRHARAKRAALAAHSALVEGGRLAPVMRAVLRLPPPLFAVLLGREWFAEVSPRR